MTALEKGPPNNAGGFTADENPERTAGHLPCAENRPTSHASRDRAALARTARAS